MIPIEEKSRIWLLVPKSRENFRLGTLIKWVSIQNSSKNPKGPIEVYKKVWNFLGYFRVDIWAPIGPKEVENTNKRNYLMGNSQKKFKNLNSPIEA